MSVPSQTFPVKTDSVVDVSEPQINQALGALRVLKIITDDEMKSRSLTLLGPNTPYPTTTAPTIASEPPATEPGNEPTSPADGNVAKTQGRTLYCSACGAPNKSTEERKFYAVIAGREVGVVEGWENVLPLVKRQDKPGADLSGARSHAFCTRAEAEACFCKAQQAGIVGKIDG